LLAGMPPGQPPSACAVLWQEGEGVCGNEGVGQCCKQSMPPGQPASASQSAATGERMGEWDSDRTAEASAERCDRREDGRMGLEWTTEASAVSPWVPTHTASHDYNGNLSP